MPTNAARSRQRLPAPPVPAPHAAVLRDRQVDVETPEHVAIGYELADLGSRFTALLIDKVLQLAGFVGVLLLVAMINGAVGGGAELFEGVWLAIIAAVGFLLQWGYGVLYEGLRDGQTPGKRRMGIRVVQDGGYPVTLQAAAVRNLMRLVDAFPQPSCLVAGLTMTLHPQTKRLGDLAAGTVVVRDRSGQAIPEEAAPTGPTNLGQPRMTVEEFSALSLFLDRRNDLTGPARVQLSRTLFDRLARHFADDPRRAQMAIDDFLALAHAEEGVRRAAAGASGRSGSAQASALVRRQRPEWDEYRRLLEDAQKGGLRRLDEATVSRFAGLYRGIAADLARARTYGGSPELLYSLERQVGAGHNLLYRAPARSWKRMVHWLAKGFPALVRRRWLPIALATALFYGPGVITYAYVRANPDEARELVGPEMMARAEEAEAKSARGEGYVEIPEIMMPAMATRIIANNIQVTFMAFAGGILASLGTVAVLIFNGVHLGSVFAVFANFGHAMQLGTFVIAHGVIELTAICIAGGAGLLLGSAMILPGRRTRREALVIRGREAISLIGGTAFMLLVAGTIEGFISPSAILPMQIKFAVGILTGILMIAYFGFAGRASDDPTAPKA